MKMKIRELLAKYTPEPTGFDIEAAKGYNLNINGGLLAIDFSSVVVSAIDANGNKVRLDEDDTKVVFKTFRDDFINTDFTPAD
jgi:hypothetical protein